MSSAPTDDQDAADETEVRIRRAPKYSAFMIVGGGVGAMVTFILTAIFPVDPQVGFGALFAYFALYGVTAGVLAGALLALTLDRIGLRRSRPATVVTEPVVEETMMVADDAPEPAAPPVEPTPGATPTAPDTTPGDERPAS
jgi:hypothetical protein